MHNCRTTRENFTEDLLADPRAHPEVLNCEECNNEYQQTREALRITRRQLDSALPSDRFFNGYHARLRQRLAEVTPSKVPLTLKTSNSGISWIRRVVTASISVPVPVAAMLLVGFIAGALLMAPSKELVRELEPKVTIVEVPVEVPVIREKVVTKVVYRKERRRDSQTPRDLSGSTYAKSQKAPGLEGFEPLNEVKATIIKGGTPDEK